MKAVSVTARSFGIRPRLLQVAVEDGTTCKSKMCHRQKGHVMSSDEFTMSVGLAHELEMAFRRNGWSAEEVNRLSEGDTLGKVRRKLFFNNPDLSPWKTVEIGTHTSVESFLTHLYPCVTGWARDVMNQPEFTLADEREEIDLVVITPRDLGFRKGAQYDEIVDRATSEEYGLKQPTAEVAPQLRIDYKDQPKSQLVVAHEPIAGSGGRWCLLVVSGRVLRVRRGRVRKGIWSSDCQFVFAR